MIKLFDFFTVDIHDYRLKNFNHFLSNKLDLVFLIQSFWNFVEYFQFFFSSFQPDFLNFAVGLSCFNPIFMIVPVSFFMKLLCFHEFDSFIDEQFQKYYPWTFLKFMVLCCQSSEFKNRIKTRQLKENPMGSLRLKKQNDVSLSIPTHLFC